MRTPALERFWRHVEKQESGCWQWVGSCTPRGYGRFYVDYRDGKTKLVYPHRFAYETWIAKIPDDWTIDHLCENKGCVNPEHLEPVTRIENSLRWIRAHGITPTGHDLDSRRARRNIHQGRWRAKVRAEGRALLSLLLLIQFAYFRGSTSLQ